MDTLLELIQKCGDIAERNSVPVLLYEIEVLDHAELVPLANNDVQITLFNKYKKVFM